MAMTGKIEERQELPGLIESEKFSQIGKLFLIHVGEGIGANAQTLFLSAFRLPGVLLKHSGNDGVANNQKVKPAASWTKVEPTAQVKAQDSLSVL